MPENNQAPKEGTILEAVEQLQELWLNARDTFLKTALEINKNRGSIGKVDDRLTELGNIVAKSIDQHDLLARRIGQLLNEVDGRLHALEQRNGLRSPERQNPKQDEFDA